MSWLGSLLGTKKKIHPVHVDDANFASVVAKSELPVVLDVWSAGCGPCKQLEEIMVDLANRYEGRVKVCEMGTHFAPQAAARLRISATPTVLYFQNGRELERVMGFRGSLFHRQTVEELFLGGEKR
ncbi:MAG: thiol reductase thioredoxin [Sandaracinus sp.]|jgi:thioredoxin-like negative regulator of GroEL|nr:thiol reductase thioredoxin [Sandaracinus sp.]MCB9631145.1 thiol reductase thioredoxin [Sandaracinus sp.]